MIRVPPSVSARIVDEWADVLGQNDVLQLQLDAPARGRVLSESRLVGLFAQAQFLGRSVNLHLGPALSLDYFSGNVLALVLGLLSEKIVSYDGTDVTARVRYQLKAIATHENGVLGTSGEYLLPVLDSSDPNLQYTRYPFLADIEAHTFPLGFERLLTSMFKEHQNAQWASAAQFIFEMWQNTLEHGRDDLGGKPIDGFRCVIARIFEMRPSDGLGDQFVNEYVAAVRQRFGTAFNGLIELSVCDSGVGIATRLSRDPNLRERSDAEQFAYLQEAMTPGGTSKKRRGSGLGYPKTLRVVNRTGGLLLLRTGELTAGKTYLPPFEEWPSAKLYNMSATRAGVVRGTTVSLILPVITDW